MKHLLLLGALAALPGAVLAAPAVNFHGEVSTQTCQITINGATNSIVLLPPVAAAELAPAGTPVEAGHFDVSVTECTAAASNTPIYINFLGHNVTPDGHLGNIATANAATDVAIGVKAGPSMVNGSLILDGVSQVRNMLLLKGDTSTSQQFVVFYVSEGGNPTPGAVTGVMEYAISYQ